MFEFTRSLRFRMSAAFVLLVFLAVGSVGFVLHDFARRELERDHRQAGFTVARNLARAAEDDVLAGNTVYLQRLLGTLGTTSTVRYATVFTMDGGVLAWWTEPATTMPKSGRFLHAVDARPTREVDVGGEVVTEFDVPVLSRLAAPGTNAPDAKGAAVASADPAGDAAQIGLVRIGLSRQHLLDRLAASRERTLQLVLVALLLGTVAALGIVRSFLRPITRLTGAVATVGQGEFDAFDPTAIAACGELGELADAFGRMTRDLQAMRQRLVDANATLENKVEERTAELTRALEELRGLDMMKDDFLSSVSHEFRTPLTSIRSFSEILLAFDHEPAATQREFLEIILTESERLTRLVNDILDLVKLESGAAPLHFADVRVADVAEEALHALRPALDRSRLTAVLLRRGEVPAIRADRERLHQVLANLLSNAIKFSRDGGRIEIVTQSKGDFVEVRVVDHGVGIDPRDQRVIFERFRQVGDTLTEKPRGTGLGLPICKHIVERHGGTIAVDSQPGRGTTISFVLPIGGPAGDESGARCAAADPRMRPFPAIPA